MKPRLLHKLENIRNNPTGRDFILADAKDPDMAWGIASFGAVWPPPRNGPARFRTLPEFLEQIRRIVEQGSVDIVLTSVSVMDRLVRKQRLFEASQVTPAVRVNDTTDVWCVRGARYRESPSLPFAGPFLEEAQYGSLAEGPNRQEITNLGLFSVTFNNIPETDRQHLEAFKAFRREAQSRHFQYFLEVLPPNTDAGLHPDDIPAFVADQIARVLAPVPAASRPLFLKVPYYGSRWMQELSAYDPSVIIGIMGGSSGTTFESFQMLAEAQQSGARAALFGRRVKDAEEPLAFLSAMRRIVDGEISPEEAVRWYHDELKRKGVPARRALADDM